MATPQYKATWPRLLEFGLRSNPAVQWAQTRLQEQGFFKGTPRGNFGPLTRNAVLYFQSTHLDSKGRPLEVDGAIGKHTRWALQNPSGTAQTSGLGNQIIPGGLAGSRLAFLKTLSADYRSGKFIEVPDGSNTGPTIKRFSRGTFWCAFYQSDAWNRTTGSYPLGKDHGHCLTFWRAAKAAGIAIPKEQGEPLPGDLAIMLYRNQSGNLTGSGHIFAATRTSENGQRMNTIGGNEGNRLKHGHREVSQPTIVGWIDLHGDNRDKVAREMERGVISASAAATSTAGTR